MVSKVLMVHNYYKSASPSGEDSVFEDEVRLLRDKGVDVSIFCKHNDSIDDRGGYLHDASLAIEAVWSKKTATELGGAVRHFAPGIVHFHNTFPLISPSGYGICKRLGVPVVQTLHNYRLICPGATLMRSGSPCELCVGASLLPALRYRCYRGSLPATASVVSMLLYNRVSGAYRKLVDAYVVLTDFMRRKLILGGLPRDKILVKPNFVLQVPRHAGADPQPYAVYAGRLAQEKGVDTLIDAWRRVSDVPLLVIGDGPERQRLEGLAHSLNVKASFLGRVDKDHARALISGSIALIVPSLWYEGLPLVVLEAFSSGTPVIASDIGSLSETVHHGLTGFLFEAGNPIALYESFMALIHAPFYLRIRRNARAEFERKYSPEANFHHLMQIYAAAARVKRG